MSESMFRINLWAWSDRFNSPQDIRDYYQKIFKLKENIGQVSGPFLRLF